MFRRVRAAPWRTGGGEGWGGAGLSWQEGHGMGRPPAGPCHPASHGGACGRAGLVQPQRFAQPAGKIDFFRLGPFDEGVVLKGKEGHCEQAGPGICKQEGGASLLLGLARPSGMKSQKPGV